MTTVEDDVRQSGIDVSKRIKQFYDSRRMAGRDVEASRTETHQYGAAIFNAELDRLYLVHPDMGPRMTYSEFVPWMGAFLSAEDAS